jgi:hypothetical protein
MAVASEDLPMQILQKTLLWLPPLENNNLKNKTDFFRWERRGKEKMRFFLPSSPLLHIETNLVQINNQNEIVCFL